MGKGQEKGCKYSQFYVLPIFIFVINNFLVDILGRQISMAHLF